MPKKDSSYGKSLLKIHKRRCKVATKGYRHSCDIPDGEEDGKLNLKSITHQSDLQEFLESANIIEDVEEESGTKIVRPDTSNGILTEEQLALIASIHDENKKLLTIPRRPPWDTDTSKEVLDAMEKEAFLVWRRKLVEAQAIEHIQFTPFEKNLEVWKQLWRVIERSNVIVQILDARNPLLFRSVDLELYVQEINETKTNILLLNKADLLTENQRKSWCEYFEKSGIQIIFFSALQQMERLNSDEPLVETSHEQMIDVSQIRNTPKVLSREELVIFFKLLCKTSKSHKQVATVGLVGYPNVGKSSTINAILLSKKVSVSATPGKTKHFQTLHIDEELILCDCPGLVFPNFVSTKADLVINGILPIDQLTEYNKPISLVTHLIPRHVLEATYSIFIPPPTEDRSPDSPPTADEFLNPYGYNRGYMSPRGLPDNSKSARYILKDFVNGKLLYCYAPPGFKQEDYHTFPEIKFKAYKKGNQNQVNHMFSEEDQNFFSKVVHLKGQSFPKIKSMGQIESASSDQPDSSASNKPWRKHNNKNKKEKLRRIYGNPWA